MKRLITTFFIILGSLTLKPMAQLMFYGGADAFNYTQTEKNDLTNSRISQGSFILNPCIGLGLNIEVGSNFIVFRSEVIYGAAAFTMNKQKAFGNLAVPVQLGFGYYKKDLFFLQLLYGYQFNFQDLYKTNTILTSSQLNFNTHTLEAYAGFGDDNSLFTSGPYVRVGIGGMGRFCFHLGFRLGLSSEFF